MIDYPPQLPSDALDILVTMVTSRSFDKNKFALALWNIEGFALSKALSFNLIGAQSSVHISDEEALSALKELQASATPPQEGVKTGFIDSMILKQVLLWALQKAITLL